MSYVDSTSYVREGLLLNGDATSLKEAVDRAGLSVTGGSWWQQWMGFYGSWTQYYAQNIQKPPILPIQDDGDLKQWGTDLDKWKKDFAGLEQKAKEDALRKGQEPPASQLSTPFATSSSVDPSNRDEGGKGGGSSSMGKLVTGALIVTSLFGLGYVLNGARVFTGR